MIIINLGYTNLEKRKEKRENRKERIEEINYEKTQL